MTAPTRRPKKEMIFDWCKSGKHDKCRTQYGGDRIVCICDCGDEHGVNYKPISKSMTEEEVNTSISSLNEIMVGDAGDGESENRAVKSSSPIWGDQVKEAPKQIGTYYTRDDIKRPAHSSYYYQEAKDAENIEELEQRRAAGSKPTNGYLAGTDGFSNYEGFSAWL